MDVTALQALPEGGSALSRQRQAGQLAPADKAWLQGMLESAMQQALTRCWMPRCLYASPLPPNSVQL